ncbi:MAG: hypothetical protein KDC26_13220 [Armatimonadetes bacterium]|nr:hypothetical protein [Armatimonadota bacterium]
MSRVIEIEVEGQPPIKGEALSLMSPRHKQSDRVVALLSAVQRLKSLNNFTDFGYYLIRLEVEVRCTTLPPKGNATNYLCGISDVLQARKPQGIDHLGELAGLSLFDNDRQNSKVTYRAIPS